MLISFVLYIGKIYYFHSCVEMTIVSDFILFVSVMALLKTMSKKVLSLLRKRRMFKILTLLFYSEIWVVLYSLFWVRHLFYSLWVNIALYSGFRCHCECVLLRNLSKILLTVLRKTCSLLTVSKNRTLLKFYVSLWMHFVLLRNLSYFYSKFVCHCECIFLLKYVSWFYARIFCSVNIL
jgi:hypothetical protein